MNLQDESLPFPVSLSPSKMGGKLGNATVRKFCTWANVNCQWVQQKGPSPTLLLQASGGGAQGDSHLWSFAITKKSHPFGFVLA